MDMIHNPVLYSEHFAIGYLKLRDYTDINNFFLYMGAYFTDEIFWLEIDQVSVIQ